MVDNIYTIVYDTDNNKGTFTIGKYDDGGDRDFPMNIFESATECDAAYGIYISVDDSLLQLIDEMRACDARKKVDIAIKYNEDVKEFELDEFLQLLGFIG